MTFPVYIVGAGPGDPELLTIKAIRLLNDWAEVVVYDRLIPDDILDVIPQSVEKIYAGKSCRKHVLTQEEINEVLVAEAKKNRKVVRLKGGDPFIFGRGGEETEHLAKNGVSFEVVPGISAASGISSCYGVPLTHRGVATSVRFITGHQQKGEPTNLDWEGLANDETTIVVYMGLANLANITENLIKAGLPEDTPAIVVQEGTTDKERSCTAPLSKIADEVKKQKFAPPAIAIIGRVVALASR